MKEKKNTESNVKFASDLISHAKSRVAIVKDWTKWEKEMISPISQFKISCGHNAKKRD